MITDEEARKAIRTIYEYCTQTCVGYDLDNCKDKCDLQVWCDNNLHKVPIAWDMDNL